MRRDIEFRTEDDVILRGWHYLPDGAGPTPTVVMAHGYSAVKEMYLDRFAEALAEAGIGAVVFDNRNFGASDGEPRQEIDPWQQIRDYRDAITWASGLSEVDAERIGIWGSSYSGARVLVLGAIDRQRARGRAAAHPRGFHRPSASSVPRGPQGALSTQAAGNDTGGLRKPDWARRAANRGFLAVVHRNRSHPCAGMAQRGHAALGRDVPGIRTGRARHPY